MKYNTNVTALAILLTSALSVQGYAQTVPPSQDSHGQVEASPASEQSKSKKAGYLRLWNFSYPKDLQGVAVFLGPASAQLPPPEKRLWIARGSQSPEQRNYWEVQPGQYEIFVIADDSVQGDTGTKIGTGTPASASLLSRRQGIQVNPQSYQTIILYQQEGKLVVRLLDDSARGAGVALLRIFTFNTAIRPTVSMLSASGQRKTIVENVGPEGTEAVIDIQASPLTLEVSYPAREDFISRQNVEPEFNGNNSCSLIFAPDRYGSLSVECVKDAPIP